MSSTVKRLLHRNSTYRALQCIDVLHSTRSTQYSQTTPWCAWCRVLRCMTLLGTAIVLVCCVVLRVGYTLVWMV